MTREEIIRVARGAGLLRMTPIPDDSEFVADLERFAALVEQRAAAAEREACAKECERLVKFEYATGKVDHNERGWTELCASLIRARGKP